MVDLVNMVTFPRPHRLAMLIMEAQELLQRSWNVMVTHILKLIVQVHLANYGIQNSESYCIWDLPTSPLETLLLNDSRG